MTVSGDFKDHLEDAKGLVQAVRFTGRSIDEGQSMLRDAFEALANGLEDHLVAIEKAHMAAVRPAAVTAEGARTGVGTPRKTAKTDLSPTMPAMPNRTGKTG